MLPEAGVVFVLVLPEVSDDVFDDELDEFDEFESDEVVVGVATGGSAPILARDVRSRIEAVLPAGLTQVAKLARDLRETVIASVPDFMARRRFWEKAFRGPAADLAACFVDMRALLGTCRFSNCRHAGEPGCGIDEAARGGRIEAQRVESYRRILRSIRNDA